jgi:hypothetical protein
MHQSALQDTAAASLAIINSELYGDNNVRFAATIGRSSA